MPNLLQIARALDVSLQRLLTGRNRPGDAARDLAIELRSLGLIDLWVDAPVVPGAFRRPEEVVARALAGKSPEARIIEALPATTSAGRLTSPPAAPVWKRWRINYAADFATFRQRAEALLALARAERRRLPFAEVFGHEQE